MGSPQALLGLANNHVRWTFEPHGDPGGSNPLETRMAAGHPMYENGVGPAETSCCARWDAAISVYGDPTPISGARLGLPVDAKDRAPVGASS